MINKLRSGRVLSIDAFRGITILVMIFVNALADVNGIPSWMKHAHADEDRMTFVDAVFPAFLFIVGMSIPFAINNRLAKGDSWQKIQYHILWRTLGLLVLGVFSLLYYLIEVKQLNKWTNFFRPAGSNPLLTYILPDITFYLLMLLGIRLPEVLSQDLPGIIWCMCFAILMLWLVKGLNKLHIRLQL